MINVPEKPPAAFICPGHPLLDATIGLLLERERDVLQQGAILIDDTDPGDQPRALFYLEQALQDSTPTMAGERRVISREVHFVEIDAEGDYSHRRRRALSRLPPGDSRGAFRAANAPGAGLAQRREPGARASAYAIEQLVPQASGAGAPAPPWN